jgi:uncharacterized membrane protein
MDGGKIEISKAFIVLVPIISVIVGALLSFVGQIFFFRFQKKSEMKEAIQKSTCDKILNLETKIQYTTELLCGDEIDDIKKSMIRKELINIEILNSFLKRYAKLYQSVLNYIREAKFHLSFSSSKENRPDVIMKSEKLIIDKTKKVLNWCSNTLDEIKY